MKILVNDKEVDFKEFMEVINDIWLIVNGKCGYCERNNLDDRGKLELIKKIMTERLNFKG